MKKSISGFTIVELLIVIVVIAILAAISVVAYSSIQNRGYDSSVQTSLSNIAKQLEIARIGSPNTSYPYSNQNFNFVVKVDKSAYVTTPAVTFNLIVCLPNTSNAQDYIVLATSKSGKRFYIEPGSGVKEYTGAADWTGSVGDSLCSAMKSGWIGGGAGYSSADTTTGPWRTWAGGN